MERDPRFGGDVRAALAALPDDCDDLKAVSILRKTLPAETARWAATQHRLRAKSRRRFEAGRLEYLTAKGLEQATTTAVASFRAQHIHARGTSCVWDATCGLGSDSIALAQHGVRVVASDLDPETVACARANLERYGTRVIVVRADAVEAPTRAAGILLDPDRRSVRRRAADPGDWSPTMEQALTLARKFDGACIKLAPAF